MKSLKCMSIVLSIVLLSSSLPVVAMQKQEPVAAAAEESAEQSSWLPTMSWVTDNVMTKTGGAVAGTLAASVAGYFGWKKVVSPERRQVMLQTALNHKGKIAGGLALAGAAAVAYSASDYLTATAIDNGMQKVAATLGISDQERAALNGDKLKDALEKCAPWQIELYNIVRTVYKEMGDEWSFELVTTMTNPFNMLADVTFMSRATVTDLRAYVAACETYVNGYILHSKVELEKALTAEQKDIKNQIPRLELSDLRGLVNDEQKKQLDVRISVVMNARKVIAVIKTRISEKEAQK